LQNLEKESRKIFDAFNAKVEIKGRILRVSNAMDAIQGNFDIIINSILNAQRGTVQPQIISPKELMDNLIRSVPTFPEDTTLAFHMSKTSTHLVFRVCSLQVYISEEILRYIIGISLVGRGSFGIYKLIPKPVASNHIKYLYVETEKNLLIDRLG
jgi:hypothetical protein